MEFYASASFVLLVDPSQQQRLPSAGDPRPESGPIGPPVWRTIFLCLWDLLTVQPPRRPILALRASAPVIHPPAGFYLFSKSHGSLFLLPQGNYTLANG